jgi:hypothetical protein
MKIENKIKNSHLLTDIFSQWPSFHDAELLQITLKQEDKNNPNPHANVVADIHVFEITDELNENGSYKLKNQTLVRFLFTEITDLQINGFNYNNSGSLGIIDISNQQMERMKFQVSFDISAEQNTFFRCFSISIESAEPYKI